MPGKSKPKTKRPARKSRVPCAVSTGREEAYCVATTTVQNLGTSVVKSYINCSLDQFTRPVNIARNYQLYRISKIEMRFKPQYDTFLSGQGATLVPYLHYMVDKSGSIPTTVSLSNLIQLGAKPIRFDDKTITKSYTPTVILDSQKDSPLGSSPAAYKVAPWLSTNYNVSAPVTWTPNSTNHYGVYWCVAHNGTSQFNYDVEISVHFEFKKQLVTTTTNIAAEPIIIEGEGSITDPLYEGV